MAITKVLHSTNPIELNNQLVAAMAQGLRPVGGVTVVDKGPGHVFGFYQTVSDTFPQDGESAYQVWLDAGNTGTVEQYFAAIAGQRMKSEVLWTSLSLVIPETPTNLITLLKANAPASGTLAPLFNTTTDKMTPYNQPTTLTFKLNLQGTWASGTTANRSMTVSFGNSTANVLSQNRIAGSAVNSLSFPTFFSVDLDGALATGGSTILINTTGDVFTANTVLLVAEQRVFNVV